MINMPVLTEEERTRINDSMPSEAKYGEVFEAVAKAQRDACLKIAEAAVEQAKKDGYKQGVEDANKAERMDLEQARQETAREIEELLDLEENESGWVRISNHVNYTDYQALKEKHGGVK